MGIYLLSTNTADTATPAVITITGIDGTYNEYQFQFVNIHPSVDSATFQFQVNASDDEGGDYDLSPITSTFFKAEQAEDSAAQGFAYSGGYDVENDADFRPLAPSVQHDDDSSASGVLTLYDPSSTVYVKHFISQVNCHHHSKYSFDAFAAGYINETTAITQIKFMFSSGNIDAGTIYMYGVG